MAKLTANIVGMHFRPPAKDVVNMLPTGAHLLLQREPTNEYDEFAVKVLLPNFNEEAEGPAGDICRKLKEEGNYGVELFTDPLHLAYVDSKKTGLAKMFSQDMKSEQEQYEGSEGKELLFDAILLFDLAGKPQVGTDLVVSSLQYEVDRAEPVNDPDRAERQRANFEASQQRLADAAAGKPPSDDDIPF